MLAATSICSSHLCRVAASDILLFEVKTAVVLPIHLSGTEKSEVQVRERLFKNKKRGKQEPHNQTELLVDYSPSLASL
jgi:hypothetical protein